MTALGGDPAGHRRTAVITGAARGIGQEYARRLAQDGVRVVVADVLDASETLALISDAGSEGIAVHCDVSSPDSVEHLKTEVDAFGGADILVHNAGVWTIEPFEAIDFATWRRVQTINVDALFLLTQAFLPTMRERGWGRIVGIASATFNIGTPGAVHYVTSKGAVTGFVRSLAAEVGAQGITVNAIAPGLIRTPGTSAGPHDELGLFDITLTMQDIKRTGMPADVAGALAFIVSEEAGFMTGQTMLMDGGVART